MRLCGAVALVTVLLGVSAPARQATPTPDPVAPLLSSLAAAIAANDVAAFRALLSPRIPELDSVAFEVSLLSGGVTGATVRERDRERTAGATRVLAEFLVNRSGAGQITTWQVGVAAVGGVIRIASLRQISSINGLHRLELDTSSAFEINNFAFTATDFRLTMTKGTAFVGRTAGGITALVLRGSGRMLFEPSDPIERHQIKRYARTETLNDEIDAAFLRISPAEFQTRISEGSLRPIAATSGDTNRARSIFNQWAGRSYNVALGDLSAERWTLLPPPGDALADIQTRHFRWLTYSRAASQNEDVQLFDRENRKNLSVYASPAKIATRGRFYNEDDDRAYDIEHYELNVRFPEPQPVGKVLTISVTYSGRLVPQSLSREAAEVTPQTGNTQENAMPPEPNYAYSNNSFWYPQSTVNDYATARIRIAVPQEYQAVSTGTLIDEGVVGDDRVAAFSADVPARYLTTIVSRMVPLPRSSVTLPSGKTLTIDAQSNPRQLGGTKTLTARAAEIMKFYASIVGEVPFPSFTLLSLEADFPGGHSPAYFAAINQPTSTTAYTWRNDPIAFDDQFPNFYLAHEIAHQWWGQAIGTKNYHDQWLSEGLAQYFAYLYAGTDRGLEVQRSILERMRDSVRRYSDSGPISIGYRLGHAVGDGTNFRAIVYNKSAVVLDMLRGLIGDEAFTAGLRRFYQERKFQKAGTDDLRQAFEAEAHQPLTRFFDRWVMNAGLPNLKLTAVIETSGEAALLRIDQTGDIYDLPVAVSIAYQDLPTEYLTLRVRSAQTEERVVLKGKVRSGGIRLVPGL